MTFAICSVLPPLSNGWRIIIVWFYVALNGTPNFDCYWGWAVPKLSSNLRLSNLGPEVAGVHGWTGAGQQGTQRLEVSVAAISMGFWVYRV